MKYRIIKTILLLAVLGLPWLTVAQGDVAKPKRIYITLDVSSSMAGNKYIMANYAAQIISVFASEEDQVRLYYFGREQDLNAIVKPFEDLDEKKQNTYNEISDLTQFLKDYVPDPKYEDWLFIIGDGDWSMRKGKYDSRTEFEATWAAIRSKPWFGDGRLNICYLQTGDSLDDHTVFTDSISNLKTRPGHPSIDIRKSDKTAESVRENCIYFANRILGFSNQPVRIEQAGKQCVSFESEFPLNRFVLMYQSEKEGALVVNSIAIGAETVADSCVKLKGNPSTKELIEKGGVLLNSAVWEVSRPQGVPANEEIKVCFNGAVEADNMRLYPYVDVFLHMRPWSPKMDTLYEISPNIYAACDTLEQLAVVLAVTDRNGNKFPPPLMKKMIVQFVIDGVADSAFFEPSDTTFRIVAEMPNKELAFFATIESPGYFTRSNIDEKQSVRKTLHCEPDPEFVPLITLPKQLMDPVTFRRLIDGDSFGGVITDTLFRRVDSAGFLDQQSVADMNDYPYIEDVSLIYGDGRLKFVHRPHSNWCECAFPDTLRYLVTLRNEDGISCDGKIYEGFVIPVSVPIDKRGWWPRCRWYVFLGGGLLLLIFYLLLLFRKKRFRKSAAFAPAYFDYYGNRIDNLGETSLREAGFAAWFVRWFIPIRERNTLYFDSPRVESLGLVADDSDVVVRVKKTSIDPSTMKVKGYKPEKDTDKSKYIKLGDNDKIYVTTADGDEAGDLTFHHGETVGGKGYRLFVSLMIMASLATLILIIITLLKSINLI